MSDWIVYRVQSHPLRGDRVSVALNDTQAEMSDAAARELAEAILHVVNREDVLVEGWT